MTDDKMRIYSLITSVIILAIVAILLSSCKGDEIIVDNDTPNCPEGTIFDSDSNACIPEELTDVIFDLMLTIKDCVTGNEMNVDSVTFVDVRNGYEQEFEKLLNQPEGVYMLLSLIMGNKYYIEIENDGYETLEGEFQVTQQTDEVCLNPLASPNGFPVGEYLTIFEQCLSDYSSYTEMNALQTCCDLYPETIYDGICGR